MDFARKQLEKYGWSDGKGLGKNENGISEALKPKLKRSVTGIGHDPASDFTEHWWTNLYNKAAGNLEVQEKNGKTKKIKVKDDQFKITNSSYHLNKKTDSNQEEYSDFFVKTAVLTNGVAKTERVIETDSESEGPKDKKDVFKMTDEELFAACQGRTAHKGARHGLRAEGKLARIQRQEQMLLAEAKYNGYSHAKKKSDVSITDLKIVEDINLNSDSDVVNEPKKKKKKRKRCFSNENFSLVTECHESLLENSDKINDDLAGNETFLEISKKTKKSQGKSDDGERNIENRNTDDFSKSKKKRNHKNEDLISTWSAENYTENLKKKKKNGKSVDLS